MYKKIRYEFHIFRFSNVAFDQLVGYQQAEPTKPQEKEKTLLINKG